MGVVWLRPRPACSTRNCAARHGLGKVASANSKAANSGLCEFVKATPPKLAEAKNRTGAGPSICGPPLADGLAAAPAMLNRAMLTYPSVAVQATNRFPEPVLESAIGSGREYMLLVADQDCGSLMRPVPQMSK
jgi:hypothetical protein